MTRDNWDWDFGKGFGFGFGPRMWAFCWPERGRARGGRRRRQIFESGDVKFVILRLLREKQRHGYEVIKALEEKMGGWYTPSAGTVYPTLQLLEDQGYVRIEEVEGKKVYHVTPEGERFLDENRAVLDDILDRVRDAVQGVAGGAMGEMNKTFARLSRLAYSRAFRAGADSDRTRRIAEILRRAADEIEGLA